MLKTGAHTIGSSFVLAYEEWRMKMKETQAELKLKQKQSNHSLAINTFGSSLWLEQQEFDDFRPLFDQKNHIVLKLWIESNGDDRRYCDGGAA